jgi:hypothetical protein
LRIGSSDLAFMVLQFRDSQWQIARYEIGGIPMYQHAPSEDRNLLENLPMFVVLHVFGQAGPNDDDHSPTLLGGVIDQTSFVIAKRRLTRPHTKGRRSHAVSVDGCDRRGSVRSSGSMLGGTNSRVQRAWHASLPPRLPAVRSLEAPLITGKTNVSFV